MKKKEKLREWSIVPQLPPRRLEFEALSAHDDCVDDDGRARYSKSLSNLLKRPSNH